MLIVKPVIFFLLLTQCVYAQQTQEKKHRYLGFGFNFGALQSTEFLINVDPIKYFRTEIKYGQYKTSKETVLTNSAYQSQTVDLNTSSRSIRVGLFGLLPLDEMLLFSGLRYSWGKTANQYLEYNYNFNYHQIAENNNLINQIEMVLGSEYRFANRVALGAEIAFIQGKTDYNNVSLNPQRGTNTFNYFRTTAFIRFFPF